MSDVSDAALRAAMGQPSAQVPEVMTVLRQALEQAAVGRAVAAVVVLSMRDGPPQLAVAGGGGTLFELYYGCDQAKRALDQMLTAPKSPIMRPGRMT